MIRLVSFTNLQDSYILIYRMYPPPPVSVCVCYISVCLPDHMTIPPASSLVIIKPLQLAWIINILNYMEFILTITRGIVDPYPICRSVL